MSEFELSRRNFLKFAAVLGITAAAPVKAIEALVPPIEKAVERFVGPRLEIFVDDAWMQIPGLTDLSHRESNITATEVLARASGVPGIITYVDGSPGYILQGIADDRGLGIVTEGLRAGCESREQHKMRIVWREMLIEFEGLLRSIEVHVWDMPRWYVDIEITGAAPRIHCGLP